MARQELIKWMANLKSDIGNAEHQSLWHYEQAIDMAIEALQDRPTGTWIIKQGNYCGVELKEFFCDRCGTRGALRRVYSDPEPLPNFCSNCGAEMRGGAE